MTIGQTLRCNIEVGDTVTFSVNSQTTGASEKLVYVLTDASGNIQYHTESLPILGVASGKYFAYTINYDTTGTAPNIASNEQINNLGGDCVDISAPLAYGVCDCNNQDGSISFNSTGSSSGSNFHEIYILTDGSNNILDTAINLSFTGLMDGVYNVFALNYDTSGTINNLGFGNAIASITGSCFDISEPIGFVICLEAPPVVLPNPIITPQDSTATVCMAITDANEDDTFTTTLCSGGPINGTASSNIVEGGLCIDYTPNPGYSGTEEICVVVCDQTGLCDTVQVPVTVVPSLPPTTIPQPPIVVEPSITTPEDSTVSICTSILDANPSDTTFTAALCTGSPANGTATVSANGSELCIEYTPNSVHTGNEEVCVIVCDMGGLCDTVSIPVTIVPTVEPPLEPQSPVVVLPPVVNPTDSMIMVCGAITDANPNDTFSVQICNIPANVMVMESVNNATDQVCLDITPNPGFEGTDSVCVIVCDQTGLCDTVIVPIEILPSNDAPIAIDDINTTLVDEPVSGGVLPNDSDPEEDALTVNTTPLNPTNGNVVIDAAGNYTFTPTMGFVGEATFQYEVCDNGSPTLCDTATVVIEVIDDSQLANNGVTGMEDNYRTENDSTLTADLLSNDSDPDGDNLTINTTPVINPNTGTLTINPDGTFDYVPDPSFVGPVSFEYEVCDAGMPQACDTVGVMIEVLPSNGTNDLYATDDANSGLEGQLQTGNVTANDNDPENGTLTVSTTPLVNVTNGSLSLNTDGTYTYQPNLSFTGNDQFRYSVCDDGIPMACDSATVYLTVLEGQNPPLVIPSPITTPQDSTATLCVPITDLNEGDIFTANLCPGSPVNGTTMPTVNGNELCIAYIPAIGFSGTDSICLVVCDQTGRCDTATIPVTVVPTLPPVTNPAPPIAIPTTITIPQDSTAMVCTPIIDPNAGDTFTASLCPGSPANGTTTPTVNGNELCLEYEPNAGYTGDDPVCVIVCDQTGLCDTITIPVAIIPSPAPVDSMQPPILVLPPIVISEDATGTVCGPVVDANPEDTHAVTICEQPANGTASVTVDNTTNQVCVTYTPPADFNGPDSVCVKVCDQTGLCDSVMVPIEVLLANDAPVAVDDATNLNEDSPVTVDVQDNDTDPDGNPLTTTIIGTTTQGVTPVVENGDSITYTPPMDFNGMDTITYQVCDNRNPMLCDTAMVVITVDPVNDKPSIVQPLITLPEDSMITFCPTITDVDIGDILTVSACGVPSNGTVTSNDTCITYTPNSGFNGMDSICVEVCDTGGLCDSVRVPILVTPQNSCVNITTSVFLEGAYEVDSMYTKLNDLGYLPGQDPSTFLGKETPAGQPYNIAPWNYGGTEGMNMDYNFINNAGYAPTVVDWVLVSLRTTTARASTVCTRAGLLHSDGHVAFLAGSDCCNLISSQSYYVVIEHRNHLIVMSHQAIPIIGGTITYDFRSQESYKGLLGFGQKQVRPGIYAMYAGNGDQVTGSNGNRILNIISSDKNAWLIEIGDHSSYYLNDYDLNGDVNVQDKIPWSRNDGIFSDVPWEN
ncbi:MAG: Ig-like domain-containing protein [Bacteroidota bacterium]